MSDHLYETDSQYYVKTALLPLRLDFGDTVTSLYFSVSPSADAGGRMRIMSIMWRLRMANMDADNRVPPGIDKAHVEMGVRLRCDSSDGGSWASDPGFSCAVAA